MEEESQLEEFKKQINGVLAADAGVEGMILDVPGEGQDDERDEEEETGRAAVVRATKRKTAAQRRRKARQAKEVCSPLEIPQYENLISAAVARIKRQGGFEETPLYSLTTKIPQTRRRKG